MARGRIIANDITKDKRVSDLSDDTSRLAFTWLVTFADCEGRTHGDPALIRSILFPRREDITIKQMEVYIREWADLGLVIWYECNGDKWIQFPAFAKHQKALTRDTSQTVYTRLRQTCQTMYRMGVQMMYVQRLYNVPLKRREVK